MCSIHKLYQVQFSIYIWVRIDGETVPTAKKGPDISHRHTTNY